MWRLSSSSDKHALNIVDGLGPFEGHGPHYSRRTPGSKTFTGVGREVVLVTDTAVWAVVLQKTPSRRGTGGSRGRKGAQDDSTRWVWRNNMFRNLGSELSSELIRGAVLATYSHWLARYGELPLVRLRTEVDTRKIKSRNPGYCYQCAGWERGPLKRGIRHLYAPEIHPYNCTY